MAPDFALVLCKFRFGVRADVDMLIAAVVGVMVVVVMVFQVQVQVQVFTGLLV